MPKLPLFQGKRLNFGAINLLREVLQHPEINRNASLIEELEQIALHPALPMPFRLALFVCFDLCLFPTGRLNTFLTTASDIDPNFMAHRVRTGQAIGKRDLMIREINDWVVRHAMAAGFTIPSIS